MKNVAGWILAVFLALVFVLAGGIKLIGAPAMVQEFAQIGFGQWFRFVTGILEVAGAIGLLIPRFRFWAVPGLARVTAVLMTLALVVGWLRRPLKEKT